LLAREPFDLLLALLMAFAVRMWAPDERKRVRLTAFFMLLHVLLTPAVGALQAAQSGFTQAIRLLSLTAAVIAAVGVVTILVFGVILPRIGLTLVSIVRDLISTAVAFIALLSVAHHQGFALSGLLTTSAVVSAMVVFSMQEPLSNIMGGVFLHADSSIQVGDWVKIGDMNGKVTEMRWRYTAIETRNWETIIVPNGYLMKNQFLVLGRRRGQPVQWRRWVWFNVDYRHSPSEIIAIVNEALKTIDLPAVAKDPVPHAVCMDIGSGIANVAPNTSAVSYCRYGARYWLTDLARDDPTDSLVRERIFSALTRAGIDLSLPAETLFVTRETKNRKQAKREDALSRHLQVLSGIDLFDDLTGEEKQKLAADLRYSPFAAGEVMTRQGNQAHWLYILTGGEASVVVSSKGSENEVARLRAGDFFGEMSLMTGEPRAATVEAISDVKCYRLGAAHFKSIIAARPDIANHVAEILAERKLGLDAARDELDEESRRTRFDQQKVALLTRIRDFFGLDTPA
jgi:small-conductance mechanosensitive channel/CRP-like cAMP-binding protein